MISNTLDENIKVYLHAISLPSPLHRLPRPLLLVAWPGVEWGGVNPLWVYRHVGYRISDICMHE